MPAHAATCVYDLHLPMSRSLKAKRALVRPLVEGIRQRFKVSVAEVDYHEQWQRAMIGVAVIVESQGHLQNLLDAVERFVVSRPDVEIIGVATSWLEQDVSA